MGGQFIGVLIIHMDSPVLEIHSFSQLHPRVLLAQT